MIIKGIRVPARQGVQRLVRHLYEGDENEAIRLVQGTPADVADMHADARERGRTYSVRHWIVSPREATNERQFRLMVDMLGREFHFEPERAVIVEHAKSRATPEAFGTHWHVLLGEVDPVSGRVLSSSHNFARHELLARWFEVREGHEIIPGPNTAAVVSEMRRRGLIHEAEAVQEACAKEGQPRREAYTHAQHQEAKRKEIDLPALRVRVRDAWVTTADRKGFEVALAKDGLRIANGDRAGTWIVEAADGALIGAVDRLVGVRKRMVRDRLEIPDAGENPPAPDAQKESTEAEQLAAARRTIEDALSRMETEANKQIRSADQTAEIRDDRPRMKRTLLQADKRVDEVVRTRSEIEIRFFALNARPPRWWWWPLRRARWQARMADVGRELASADRAVEMAQSTAARAKVAFLREEKRLREARAADLRRRDDLRRTAEHRLRLAKKIRNWIDREPALAKKGMDWLLKNAEQQNELDEVNNVDFSFG